MVELGINESEDGASDADNLVRGFGLPPLEQALIESFPSFSNRTGPRAAKALAQGFERCMCSPSTDSFELEWYTNF